ncbi:hypothetical protein ES768_20325 [Salmonella enterica]|nr:hypothetical protein [Salmonella enterica]
MRFIIKRCCSWFDNSSVMFSTLLAAFSFVSTMGLANAVPPIKNVFPLLLLVLVLITNYNIYFR